MKNKLRNRPPAKRAVRDTFQPPLSPQPFEALYALYIRRVCQVSLSALDDSSGIEEQERLQEMVKRFNL